MIHRWVFRAVVFALVVLQAIAGRAVLRLVDGEFMWTGKDGPRSC